MSLSQHPHPQPNKQQHTIITTKDKKQKDKDKDNNNNNNNNKQKQQQQQQQYQSPAIMSAVVPNNDYNNMDEEKITTQRFNIYDTNPNNLNKNHFDSKNYKSG